ncbi:MAG: type II toxin-antitoxin system RelE/ParE family toxin [Coxiellaceae bacterium]|nr:type II toxin-antitoxin system RelE/ParE family toxin [Coxiellaceae bacterium]
MIRSFKSKIAEDIYNGINSKVSRKIPKELHAKVARLFDQLNVATSIDTMKIPPSNNLEKLKGNYKTYWSIRVNKQWRVIFKWENNEAIDVDVLDYH